MCYGDKDKRWRVSDTYESLCDEGRTAVEELDRNKWRIGDLASKATRLHANVSVDDYAREINLHAKTLYEYRRVAEYYPVSARTEFLSGTNISWSHFKDAVRLHDLTLSLQWLRRVSDEGWPCDEASVQLSNIVHDAFGGDAEIALTPLTDSELESVRHKFKTGLIARLIATIDALHIAIANGTY